MEENNKTKDQDLTGETFGWLTVIRKTQKLDSSGYYLWECRCQCGNTTYARKSHLLMGKKKSCGCIKKGRPSKKVNNSSRKPFTNCIYYRSNIKDGCYILTERLCETKGKCSFFKQKV